MTRLSWGALGARLRSNEVRLGPSAIAYNLGAAGPRGRPSIDAKIPLPGRSGRIRMRPDLIVETAPTKPSRGKRGPPSTSPVCRCYGHLTLQAETGCAPRKFARATVARRPSHSTF
jgi:hypothetical protein